MPNNATNSSTYCCPDDGTNSTAKLSKCLPHNCTYYGPNSCSNGSTYYGSYLRYCGTNSSPDSSSHCTTLCSHILRDRGTNRSSLFKFIMRYCGAYCRTFIRDCCSFRNPAFVESVVPNNELD